MLKIDLILLMLLDKTIFVGWVSLRSTQPTNIVVNLPDMI